MSTTLVGELGSSAEVQISAAGNADKNPEFVGMLILDVTSRSMTDVGSRATAQLDAERLGNLPLEQHVREATETVERQCIEAALAKSNGNRTAAAKILGLSRQSLHTKLNKYSLGENRN
jgi:DNA-binding NtrC family response regulator